LSGHTESGIYRIFPKQEESKVEANNKGLEVKMFSIRLPVLFANFKEFSKCLDRFCEFINQRTKLNPLP